MSIESSAPSSAENFDPRNPTAEERHISPDRMPDTARTEAIAGAAEVARQASIAAGDTMEQTERVMNIVMAKAALQIDMGDDLSSRAAQWEIAHHMAPDIVKDNRNQEVALRYDAMTGVGSRGAYEATLAIEKDNPDVSVILLDVNSFKRFNTEFTQQGGDELLKRGAQALRAAADEFGLGERVFRPGGDEFIMIVPKDKAEAILKSAEELFDEAVANYSEEMQARDGRTIYFHVSISGAIGAATERLEGSYAEAAAEVANQHLQAAKKARKLRDDPEFQPAT